MKVHLIGSDPRWTMCGRNMHALIGEAVDGQTLRYRSGTGKIAVTAQDALATCMICRTEMEKKALVCG